MTKDVLRSASMSVPGTACMSTQFTGHPRYCPDFNCDEGRKITFVGVLEPIVIVLVMGAVVAFRIVSAVWR